MNDIDTSMLIARRVNEKGGRAYFVGGCVRDELLGIEVKDIDIEVHGIEPEDLRVILEDIGEVITVGNSFGVFMLKGHDIDIALPRSERATGTGHRDFEITSDPFMGTKEAARRRDFTVNALMKDVLTGKIEDHFGGLDDLKNKVLRHIDDSTFPEDPLRVLRAAQFAARFGFTVADTTKELCSQIDISTLSQERIFDELIKALLRSDRPSVFFRTLSEMDQLGHWFPEVRDLIGVPQNTKYHLEGDVFVHTMMVIDEAASRRNEALDSTGFMLSALCHDFGKAVATTEEDGIFHAYQHEIKGLPLVENFMSRITNEKDLIRYVLNMTRFHMDPNRFAAAGAKIKSTNRLFDGSVCPEDLILIATCDARGKIPSADNYEPFLRERLAVYREYMERPYVTGNDLIGAGIKPGKEFSGLLGFAHKLRLAGVDKESALKQVLSMEGKLPPETP